MGGGIDVLLLCVLVWPYQLAALSCDMAQGTGKKNVEWVKGVAGFGWHAVALLLACCAS